MFIVHVGLVKTRSPNLSVYSKEYPEFSRKMNHESRLNSTHQNIIS